MTQHPSDTPSLGYKLVAVGLLAGLAAMLALLVLHFVTGWS